MFGLIVAESSVFTIFVVAYIFYIRKSLTGPTPNEVLTAPVLYTICLLVSSATIHFATKSLGQKNVTSFMCWWFTTIVLGCLFLYGTAREWRRLIYEDGLTISTNLFGTTYYSLIGLHSFHVVVGVLCLTLVLIFSLFGRVQHQHADRVDVLALYWHFVDAVWIVVFTVVYIVGR